MITRASLLLMISLQLVIRGFAQQQLADREMGLLQQAREIIKEPADSLKTILHKAFCDTLAAILQEPESFIHPFDSLPFMMKTTAPDLRFRLYTWELPLVNGMRICHGFLQVQEEGMDEYRAYHLQDRSDEMNRPEWITCGVSYWFGAVYYKIIRTERPDGSPLYTLLGRNANQSGITRKVIEILECHEGMDPVFGGKYFCGEGHNGKMRIVFRYSSLVSMVLRYEIQHLPEEKKWNPDRRRYETKQASAWMIVADRLIPPDPMMEGMYNYYVPASDMHDGFIFRNGCWFFFPGIDARNK